jgi:hypothetical protein
MFPPVADAFAAGPKATISAIRDGAFDGLLRDSRGRADGYRAQWVASERVMRASTDQERYDWARVGLEALTRAERLGYPRSASLRWQHEIVSSAIGRLGPLAGDPVRDPDLVVDWLAPLIEKRPLDLDDVFCLDQMLSIVEDRVRSG